MRRRPNQTLVRDAIGRRPDSLAVTAPYLHVDRQHRPKERTDEAKQLDEDAIAGGVLCGLGELALSPTMDGIAGASVAIAFGLAFLGGVVWLRRGSVGGAWLIAVLAAIELAFIPMYPRSGVWDWSTQARLRGVLADRARRCGRGDRGAQEAEAGRGVVAA